MATEKKTALAVMEQFAVTSRYEGLDPELLAELQDELADLDPEDGILYRQIKVPGGGGPAFEVQGETEDDVEPMKAVEGVIVFTHRVNAYWPGTYGEGDGSKAPACSSMDGKTGLNADTGEVCNCDTCPYNQYGTGIDDKGRQVKGKACKNMRRVYLLMSGDPNLYLLTVPPTSIRPVNRHAACTIEIYGVDFGGQTASLRKSSPAALPTSAWSCASPWNESKTAEVSFTARSRSRPPDVCLPPPLHRSRRCGRR